MKTIFNSTWVGNHICTEETTLFQLDSYYGAQNETYIEDEKTKRNEVV